MIITIGREHGSGGHEIARALAEALGYACYVILGGNAPSVTEMLGEILIGAAAGSITGAVLFFVVMAKLTNDVIASPQLGKYFI